MHTYQNDNDKFHGDEQFEHSQICCCDDCDNAYYQASDLDHDNYNDYFNDF